MITENLSTLKIHKLTQTQYDRELEAGNIDENALYLTPDEEIDLSPYATKEEIEQVTEQVNTLKSHDWHEIWLVPYSYPTITEFTAPDLDSSSYEQYWTLPEKIDSANYRYEFITEYYGMSHYNGSSSGTNTVLGDIRIVKEGSTANETVCKLFPTCSDNTTTLSFADWSKCTYTTMPNDTVRKLREGNYMAEDLTAPYVLLMSSNVLEDRVYDRVLLDLNTGYSDVVGPIQTFGIKFKYRNLGLKESDVEWS